MKKNRANYSLVNKYVGTEYVLSFFVSFAFFFFIFFINQILVIAQKVALRNVEITMILKLVILAIPQFLMYTMPFSSLASASMVIGNFSSQNEILAMRSNGIHLKRIFFPILTISLVFSCCTLWIADNLIPFTAEKYREMYSEVLARIPTIELEPFSSTQFKRMIISNGDIEDNVIHDVLILDDSDKNDSRLIAADEAKITLIDINKFIYKIELGNPRILITNAKSEKNYSLANAEDMVLYINLNSNNTGYTVINPSQMSLRELKNAMDTKEPTSFYYQYYRSEFVKKLALSFACTILIFIAFPISFFRLRYGRLVGFGLAMLCACIYWFFLYYMHTRALLVRTNPFWYLWMPNMVFFGIGLILLFRIRRE